MIRRHFIQLTATLPALLHHLCGGQARAETIPIPQPDDPSRSPLDEWLRLPIQPVWRIPEFEILDAPDHPFYILLRAIQRNETLQIRYLGGTSPGDSRTLSPALIFRKLLPDDDSTPDHLAPLYLLAWCHTRHQLRTFRLDRIQWPANTIHLP